MKSIASGELLPDADIRLPGRVGSACLRDFAPTDAPTPHYELPRRRPRRPRGELSPEQRRKLRDGVPESVFDPDNRTRVSNTRAFPYSSICSLEIFNNQDRRFFGTGFFAGPRLILTAGHNVYYHGEGFMKKINVIPGLNGDRQRPPFRTLSSSRFMTVEAWVHDADKQFDFGAIVCPFDLGAEVGWFSVSNLTENSLQGMTTSVAGYPLEAPDESLPDDATTLWMHTGRLAVEPNRLRYLSDTSRGQSGGPVFVTIPEKEDPYHAVGIHNWGFDTFNAATRINDAVFSQIIAWRQETDNP